MYKCQSQSPNWPHAFFLSCIHCLASMSVPVSALQISLMITALEWYDSSQLCHFLLKYSVCKNAGDPLNTVEELRGKCWVWCVRQELPMQEYLLGLEIETRWGEERPQERNSGWWVKWLVVLMTLRDWFSRVPWAFKLELYERKGHQILWLVGI